MNGLLTFFSLLICAVIVVAVPTLVAPFSASYGVVTVFDTAKAMLLCAGLSAIAGYVAYRQPDNGPFILKLFVSALLVRLLLATGIYIFKAQEFFGGDAITYDYFGLAQLKAWGGEKYYQTLVNSFVGEGQGSGWGMVHMVAVVYGLVGRNMLAVQFVNSVLGAATAIVIFLCAKEVFNNDKVARLAAVCVAFYPSLVLWSSQGLKDGPVVFCLAVAILATLKLGQRFNTKYIVILVCSLFSLLSLRFYVFYMLVVAIGGAFVIGMQKITSTNFARQFIIMILLGLSLTYLGVTRYANVQLENYVSLERIQRSRADAATSAQSGFGKDVDVSTTQGALSTIPVGLLYLLFAPFPWQLTSLRQSITLPEMALWWASFPLLVLGLWFSIKYRLRQISPMLIFTIMLSLAYSVFQGNVGTAYRQRAQLLVFYFIFVAVGYVLLLEKRQERRRQESVLEEKSITGRRTPKVARPSPLHSD